MPRYLIGIDLGTTNSALAYVDLQRRGKDARPDVQTFAIPQLVAPAETAPRALLPSFLYLPGAHDLPAGAAALPWDAGRSYVLGEFARSQGSRVPGRLVTSAKSWLCHAGVDRSAPLLPFNAPPDVPRISPVEASARYLRHMVEAWNHALAKDRPDDRLEKQAVVLTVPASFDDVARTLTVEAARKAGIEQLTLLEEPQAAFYCWLFQVATPGGKHASAVDELAKLKPGSRCVVVDVGGGTSDFSLIQAVEQQGELGFVRQAVGDHLLLGGDNMDLALAKFVESRLPGAGRLDAVQYGMLTQACRAAKEALLAAAPPASFTVTVMGRGRSVIGGALHAALTPADVHQVIDEGFFPTVSANAELLRGARAGLHEMGLPYVSDPAITRHLAAFLNRQIGADQAPDAILFNGGVFQPATLRERLIGVMRQWYDRADRPWLPLVLTNPSLDLAVAWGAAFYGWLRHTGGRRIGGGIARSYYVGVDSSSPADAPTDAANRRPIAVVCVVPRRLEEDKEIVLDRPELELALGQPVTFPLYSSTVRSTDRPGDVLQVSADQLAQLPPLHTILRGGKRSGTRQVPVTLAAKTTEIGTLELYCVARDGGNRWRLEFNVRDVLKEPSDGDGEPATRSVSDVWPEHQVQEAARLIRACYNDADPQSTPQELPKLMETALDAPRGDWPTGLCRRLWDFLGEVAEQRRRSPAHLSRWYHLVGYCLRPGFGDPLDRHRIEQLWKMLNSPPRVEPGRPAPVRIPESGADYWIMWRRLAGGLSGQLQNALYDRLRPVLLPGKGKAVSRPGANELAEMWRAAASLERLNLAAKEALAQVLLKTLKRPPVPTYAFWSLTRLGARVLLYGPLNVVVHPEVVAKWLDVLLPFASSHESERLGWAFCLAQLARRSGQRPLDIDDGQRERVLTALRGQHVPGAWVRMVEEVVESAGEEQSRMFGEALPIGLRLLRTEEG